MNYYYYLLLYCSSAGKGLTRDSALSGLPASNNLVLAEIIKVVVGSTFGRLCYPRLRRGRLLGASINDVPISYDRLGWKRIRNGA